MKLNHSHLFHSHLFEELDYHTISLDTCSSNICEYRVMRILESCVVYFNNLDIISSILKNRSLGLQVPA